MYIMWSPNKSLAVKMRSLYNGKSAIIKAYEGHEGITKVCNM